MTRLRERLRILREATGASKNCGWMVDEVASLLYALVKFTRPDMVIQTGHLWGKSALFVLEALTDGEGLFEDPRLNVDRAFMAFVDAHRPQAVSPIFISIDPLPNTYAAGEKGIALLNEWYTETFRFFPMNSDDFWRGHTAELAANFQGKSIMTIVDGDHSQAGCTADLEGSHNMGAQIIFVDDVDFIPEIARAVENFAAGRNYTYLPLHLYNGVGLLVRANG